MYRNLSCQKAYFLIHSIARDGLQNAVTNDTQPVWTNRL